MKPEEARKETESPTPPAQTERDLLRRLIIDQARKHQVWRNENRHIIEIENRDYDLYFSDDMSPDDREAVKEYLVFTGRAKWLVPRR